MLNRILKKYVPPHWHGIAFDGVFIVLNLTVFRFADSLLQGLLKGSFEDDRISVFILGFIIISIYIWRLAALYLKRLPLRLRAYLDETYTTDDGIDTPAYIWILSISTSILSAVIIFLAVTSFLKYLGFGDYTALSPLCLIFAVIEIWLIFRLFKKPTEKELKNLKDNKPPPKEKINKNTQLFADLGLFAYMFVWQVVYNFFVSAMFTGKVFASIGTFIFMTIVCLVAFLILYLGPRSVFLFEDAKYKVTWVSISLVFLSSYIPHLFF